MATRHNSAPNNAAPQHSPTFYRFAFAGYLAILALGLASGALSLMGA